MTEHKQQRIIGYGPVGEREFHDYILRGRELQVTVKNWNEEPGAWEEETMLLGKLVPGFESKTTEKKTRHQRRAKTGKKILVYKKVLKDRSKYHADGRRKEA